MTCDFAIFLAVEFLDFKADCIFLSRASIFSLGMNNVMFLVSITKPSHVPRCIGKRFDFSKFIVKPAAERSRSIFSQIKAVVVADELPPMPSSKYIAHLMPSDLHFLTSWCISFVKM